MKIFGRSFASLGQDVKQVPPQKQELQTASNHNKNAVFDKQGNDEAKTVIYPDLMDVLSRFEGTSDSHACSPRRRVTKKPQRYNSKFLIQRVV